MKVKIAFAIAILALQERNAFSFFSVKKATRVQHSVPYFLTGTPSKGATLPPSPLTLYDSSLTTNGGAFRSSYEKIDWEALVKYPVGLGVQMALIFGFLKGVDKIVSYYSLKIPFGLSMIFLYAFNLKSSLFSIFPQKKTDGQKLTQENWEYNKRRKPSWTPPGLAFVFGWPLLTFGLRAFTGAMVVKSLGGTYANPAIMSLMLHLGIASLWNTVYVHSHLRRLSHAQRLSHVSFSRL